MVIKVKLRNDIIGGLTTFFTMAYIVVVNPSILSSPGTGMSFSGTLTATVLLCFSMTLLMGVYAKLPFAVAPGMGINAFFAYTIVIGQGVPWQQALGIVFWAGVFFVIISTTPLRVLLANAIPHSLRIGAATGIGIFLALIGFKNAGFIVADPNTLVRFAGIDERIALMLLGLACIVWMMRRKSPFAFLTGILVVTLIAWLLGLVEAPRSFLSMPDFHSVFLKLELWQLWRVSNIAHMVGILFTDLFDSLSTFIGVAYATKLLDARGQPKNLKQGLIVDAWATLGAGLVGTSSGTAYVESAAGIEMGARSGRASIVTACCFLPCFFLAPLAAMVPSFATAAVLIVIGGLMFRTVFDLTARSIEEILPAFLTIVLIPLTFSITQGILWGFVTYVVMFLLAKRGREIPAALYGIAAISAVLLALNG